MKDWIGMIIGSVSTWILAAIDWNEWTLAFACLASTASGLAAAVCSVSKIAEQRSKRLSAAAVCMRDECEAMLSRDRVCDECIRDGGSFIGKCNFKYKHKNCPEK